MAWTHRKGEGSHTVNLGESFEVVPEILAYVCTETPHCICIMTVCYFSN